MIVRSLRPLAGRIVRAIVLSGLLAAALPAPLRADATDDYNVAVQFFKQERWDVASRSFRTFLKANPSAPQAAAARLYLGQALVAQRKFSEARDVFREYVKLDADEPGIALARFRVAECSYFVQDDQPALQELDAYLGKHPGHELVSRARLYRGQTQLRLKDAAGAAQTLSELIARKPDPALQAEAEFALARAQEVLGQTEAAIAQYEQLAADKASPFAADSHFRLGTLAFNAADYPQAARHFAALATDFPDHHLASVAILNAGYAKYSLGNSAEALADFEKAAADPQQAATAGMWIGLTHKQAGDLPQAAAAFRAAYEKDEKQPLADKLLFHWADCELRRGDYPEAKRLFAAVADRWPEGDRGDDSLHLATEAALLAGDLADAQQLNERFEQTFDSSSLRWRQQVLAGRIDLARGDALHTADAQDPAAAELFRNAADRLTRVVSESELPATQLESRLQLARAYELLSERENAIATLEPIIEAFRNKQGSPELAGGLLVQAHLLNETGRFADAAGVAQLYLDQQSPADAPAAWAELAFARTQLGDAAAAAEALDLLTQQDAAGGLKAVASAYHCAEAAYAAKNWELASALFARAATFDATAGFKSAALSGLGYSRHEAGQHAAAAEAFGELLALAPADRRLLSNAAHMRGLSLQLAGNTDEAVAAYQAGLQQFAPAEGTAISDDGIEPAQDAYRCGKGAARLLREQGKIDDADAAYASTYQVLKVLPADRQAELDRFINEWALLSYENQRYGRSDELFTRLVEQCPESELTDDAKLYLAESRFFADEQETAQAAFAALVDDPQADEFVRHRASLLLLDITADREQWEQLLKYADRFREQFPNSEQQAYARYRAGEAALQSEQLDRAVEALTALTALQDEKTTKAAWFSSVYVLLAEAQFRAKDYPAVEATVAAFRTRFPGSPLLYHADEVLGRSYIKRALLPEARASLAKVINSESGQRTKTAAKAQFHIAESYLIEKDYAAALTEYYKVYVNYMFPEWQAIALFQAGQCDESLENWKGATQSYETLIKDFPDNEYAEQARQRVTEISSKSQ